MCASRKTVLSPTARPSTATPRRESFISSSALPQLLQSAGHPLAMLSLSRTLPASAGGGIERDEQPKGARESNPFDLRLSGPLEGLAVESMLQSVRATVGRDEIAHSGDLFRQIVRPPVRIEYGRVQLVVNLFEDGDQSLLVNLLLFRAQRFTASSGAGWRRSRGCWPGTDCPAPPLSTRRGPARRCRRP